ncbi:MAG: histidinol-phosphate transaminase [Myxococcota bacterium]
MKLRELVNAHIRDLEPYSPGKPIEELERELGIRDSIKLASNECPLGPSPLAMESIFAAAEDVNRYPEDSCHYLRADLAQELGVAPESLIFAAGSDGILELLAKCFLGPGDEAVFAWPSFTMYPIVTQGVGASSVQVPLDSDLRADVDALAGAVTERTRLLLLANPNNPTGTSIGAEAFGQLLDAVPERVVIAADEAYLEYVRRSDFPATLSALRSRPTLVVLRTFSKIYGLAGLRVGYGIGDPELIGYLARARHPFNVSSLAQAAARGALRDREHVRRVRELTHQGLSRLEAGVAALDLRYAESDANFLLVDVGAKAGALYEALLKQGVITRSMEAFGLHTHLRVTVGLREENERFLEVLAREVRG